MKIYCAEMMVLRVETAFGHSICIFFLGNKKDRERAVSYAHGS